MTCSDATAAHAAVSIVMTENAELVREFLTESGEALDRLEHELGQLESSPASGSLLNSIFRSVHNIKGASGFLGYSRLEALTHAGEGLLSLLRDQRIGYTPEVGSGLLALVDALRAVLACVAATGHDGDDTHATLIAELTRLQNQPDPAGELEAIPLGRLLVRSGRATEAQVELALKAQRDGDPRFLGEILIAHGDITPEALKSAIEEQAQAEASAVEETTIRVAVGHLDQIINLAQDLDRVRMELSRASSARHDPLVIRAVRDLRLISAELLEAVSKARMQPLSTAWRGFQRMVRDLSARCGKRVRLETESREIALDKTILEAMKDPMIHILRNAVDHGIETPQARKAAGKPPEGRVTLRASTDQGSVVIEVIDDGAGVNPARVKQRALERGLLTLQQAAKLPDSDALKLVFLPGVSTAASATKVSGRGVGMDVVRTNIEKIGGTVDMQSTSGKGSRITIRIPVKSRSARTPRPARLPVRAEGNQPGAICGDPAGLPARIESKIGQKG